MNEKITEFLIATLPSRNEGIQGFLIAFLLMAIALSIRLAMDSVEAGLQYLTFFPTVTLTAVIVGFWPAIFATILGVLTATFIFTFPYYSFSVQAFQSSFWPNIVFLVDSLVVCFSIEAMHRYRLRHAQQLLEAEEVHAALQNSSKQIKQILDNLLAYVVLLDNNAVIQEINRATLIQAGQQRENMIGKNFCDIAWWSYDEKVRVQLRKAIEAAKQGQIQRYDVNVRMGGELIPVDFQISQVLDENGKMVGLLATGLNISCRKQAEAILKRHKMVIDTSHDGFWATDMEGNLIEANQAYAEMSGYSIDELLHMHISQLEAIERSKEQVQAHISKITANGYDLFETRHRHKNGHEIDIEVSVNYMGETKQFFAFFRNVTERKQTEEKLHKAKQLTDSIIDNIPALVFLKRASDLRFELVNRAGEDLLGCSSCELVGKSDYDFFPKEQAELFTAKDRQVLASGKIEDIPEEIVRTSSGEIRYLLTRKVALHDQTGKPSYLLGISLDITERKKAEEELRIAAATFETHEAIMVTDADGNILRVNQAFRKITGFSAEEVIGKNPRILSSGRHDARFYAKMWRQILTKGTWEGEIWDRRKSGGIYPKWLTITALKNAQGQTTEYVGIFSDITERKQAEEEIRNLAFYDPLTKLPNRRLLHDHFHLALAASERSGQYGAVLFLDMDKFKILNDTMGHKCGDLMLIEVAERIKFNVRKIDTVARIGGDEFVILVEKIGANANEASQKAALIAEKIRLALIAPYLIKGHEHYSSPSIGVCLYCGSTESVDELLKHADLAMYQAKNSGRNAVRFFNPKLQRMAESRAILEADLRRALAEQQFHLYYQIQVNNNIVPVGAEVLIRWQHPQRGMISPAEFIPVAEESSLILDIGNWVLECACRQLVKWSQNEQTRNLKLAVNVSAHQFRMHDFVASVSTLLRTYRIDPSLLKLELTENVVLSDIADVVTKMQALKALGIRLSLDDFGTGYSSLSYLKQLPLDQLKIDQSFVRDITSDPNDAMMVRTIIDMAKNFRLNVIAEGVESETQLDFLKQNGCMAYQGYFFGKPVPIEEFEKLLRRANQAQPIEENKDYELF